MGATGGGEMAPVLGGLRGKERCRLVGIGLLPGEAAYSVF